MRIACGCLAYHFSTPTVIVEEFGVSTKQCSRTLLITFATLLAQLWPTLEIPCNGTSRVDSRNKCPATAPDDWMYRCIVPVNAFATISDQFSMKLAL